MKYNSMYYRCKKCDEPLNFTLDVGDLFTIVEGNPRIPVLYVLGCPDCGFTLNTRLMLLDPVRSD